MSSPPTLQALKIESGFIGLMSLFVVFAAIPMGITIVWCYCHATSPGSAFESSSSSSYYYRGTRSHHHHRPPRSHSRRRQQYHQQQTQTTDSLWRPSCGNSTEERAGMCGSTSSTEMIPSSSSGACGGGGGDYSMNIHESSFEVEDEEAEAKEQRLNCQKNVLNSCLQIVIFLWL